MTDEERLDDMDRWSDPEDVADFVAEETGHVRRHHTDKPVQPADPYRVLVVIYDASTKLFHAVFFGWAPFPGGTGPIRLMSRDRTEGFATFEEAQAKLDKAVAEGFPPESAYRDEPIACDHVDGLVWLASNNWRANDPKAQFTPAVIMGCDHA